MIHWKKTRILVKQLSHVIHVKNNKKSPKEKESGYLGHDFRYETED